MNILTDAIIEIRSSAVSDGGRDVKRTILGSMPAVVLALVATMKLEKDFAKAVLSAVQVYNDPKMPDLKKKP